MKNNRQKTISIFLFFFYRWTNRRRRKVVTVIMANYARYYCMRQQSSSRRLRPVRQHLCMHSVFRLVCSWAHDHFVHIQWFISSELNDNRKLQFGDNDSINDTLTTTPVNTHYWHRDTNIISAMSASFISTFHAWMNRRKWKSTTKKKNQ